MTILVKILKQSLAEMISKLQAFDCLTLSSMGEMWMTINGEKEKI